MDANVPPIAEAGPDRTAAPGETLAFDGAASYDPDITGSWSAGPPLPTYRGAPAAAVLGTQLYVIAGYQMSAPGADERAMNATEVLDTDTLQWESRSPIPTARGWTSGLAFDGRIRVFGGKDALARASDVIEEFDPGANTWVALPPLPRRDASFEVTSLGGDIFAWYDGVQQFWRQEGGSGSWSRAASPAEVLALGQLVEIGGRLYYASLTATPVGIPDGMVLGVYDPGADGWSLLPPPSHIRCNYGGVAFRGLFVLLSGETCRGQAGFVAATEAFDPRSGTWYVLPGIPTPRDEFASGVIGDCIYTAGGSGLDHFLQYQNTEVYCAPLAFEWDFGDGANASGEAANHSYAAPGTYTVTLTVTDPLGAQGTDTLIVTVLGNRPPVATGSAAPANEGDLILLDASASADPEGDPLQFRWDFDADGTWDTPYAIEPMIASTWGDDYSGNVLVEVSDGTDAATAAVPLSVANLPPSLEPLDIRVSGGESASLALRITGEKFHDVTATVIRGGVAVNGGSLVRIPGNPDEQLLPLGGALPGDVVEIIYTPLGDPVNGQVWGATPTWLILEQGGTEKRLYHTFNARHEDTWVWTVDLSAYLGASGVDLTANATDPGSDDLTLSVDWGDGTVEVFEFPNDPAVFPDPDPSPEANPRSITATATHEYAAAGRYWITVTVEDDDGGSAVMTMPVTV